MKAAFEENPYQETPVLRGLFFSSGRQEGTPYSHFLEALGLIGDKEVLPGRAKDCSCTNFSRGFCPRTGGFSRQPPGRLSGARLREI